MRGLFYTLYHKVGDKNSPKNTFQENLVARTRLNCAAPAKLQLMSYCNATHAEL